MKYLIFRTDRIGDFLITTSLIHSIKKNDKNALVYIVSSIKNNQFISDYNFVDKIFLLKKNNILYKLKLFFQLRKYNFDTIVVSDKKNRSILLTLFLKSKKKVFNVSKYIQKKLLNLLYDDVFLDNDNQIDTPIKKILSNNCNALNIILNDESFHYLKENQFLDNSSSINVIPSDIDDYVLFHYDEKWEIENYSKAYKKASSLTDIKVKTDLFLNFLSEFSKKKSKNIILTTGTLKTKNIENLKNISKKINNNKYEINLNGAKGYLLLNQNFFAISHIISKCSLFVSCHGAFTHIASNYSVNILDIIEKNKYNHYKRITHHMIKHKFIYRDNFESLSETIINLP